MCTTTPFFSLSLAEYKTSTYLKWFSRIFLIQNAGSLFAAKVSFHSHIPAISKYPTGAMHCLIDSDWHLSATIVLSEDIDNEDIAIWGNNLPKSVSMSWNGLSGGTLKMTLWREKIM